MQLTEVDREESPQEQVLDPDLPIVDPHHHLWPSGYRIPYDLAALEADFRRGHNVEATVFVECMTSFRPDGDEALRPVGETEFVVGTVGSHTSARTDVAAGIVGWADLMSPDEAARTLDGHVEAGGDRFRGVRFNVVWHDRHSSTAHAGRPTEAHMLLDGRYRAGLREVARRGLTYDIWLYHSQLPELAATLDAVPELTFIVNHLGGPVPDEATPEARAEIFGDWQRNLIDIARRPNVVLKIGGIGMPVYGSGTRAPGGPVRPRSRMLGGPPSRRRSRPSAPSGACSRATSPSTSRASVTTASGTPSRCSRLVTHRTSGRCSSPAPPGVSTGCQALTKKRHHDQRARQHARRRARRGHRLGGATER